MHAPIKVVAVLLILLIAFIILVGLMVGWTGQSGNIMQDIFKLINNLMPK